MNKSVYENPIDYINFMAFFFILGIIILIIYLFSGKKKPKNEMINYNYYSRKSKEEIRTKELRMENLSILTTLCRWNETSLRRFKLTTP